MLGNLLLKNDNEGDRNDWGKYSNLINCIISVD